MKDYNDLMNELKELIEFAKSRDEQNEEVQKFVDEVLSDISLVKNSIEVIESRKNMLETAKEEDLKEFLTKSIEDNQQLINKTDKKYEKLINRMKEIRLEEEKANEQATTEETVSEYSYSTDESDKKSSKGKKSKMPLVYGGVALLAAGTLFASGIKVSQLATSMATKKYDKENETNTEQASENETTKRIIKDEETGKILGYYDVESNTFTSATKSSELSETEETIEITDELIDEVAQNSAKEINANLEGYNMTPETMAQMIRWINGVEVQSATEEEENRVAREFMALLGSDRDAKETFDFSKLFLQPNARKLAEDTYKVRKEVVKATGTSKSEETADLMTELMAKTMNGLRDKDGDKLTNVMNFHRLENAGSQLFILLANNYNYATLDNTRDGKYVDKDGYEYYSRAVFEAINTDCVYTYEKEDNVGAPGEGHSRETVDLLTALIYQTLNEAKEMTDNQSLTLK